MAVIIIIALIIVLFFVFKFYFIKHDTIIAFTGGLGSGKSLMSVKWSLKLLKKNRFHVFLHNNLTRYFKKVFNPKKPLEEKQVKPMLYSSIPVRISRKEMALELTEGHLLLRNKLIERSVVFIDEIGSYANQFEYKNPNILDNFNEFIRLFRHYTKGGYLVVNDQCSDNIVLEVRRRINQVFNLMHFKKILCFYFVKCRNISISEEIKTIEELDTEDNMTTLFGFMLSKGTYDTYCYSNRYITVPLKKEREYSKLKKNTLLVVSKTKKDKFTTDNE